MRLKYCIIIRINLVLVRLNKSDSDDAKYHEIVTESNAYC